MCPDNANPTGMWMLAVPASPAMGATLRTRALDEEWRLGHSQGWMWFCMGTAQGSQRALNPESARHVRTRACGGGKVHQCQAGSSDEWAVVQAGGIYGRGKLCSGNLPAC